MSNCVVFYGHGEWSPKENPAKTAVPTGCKLLLFTRHKEAISTIRMREIVYDLKLNGWDARYHSYHRDDLFDGWDKRSDVYPPDEVLKTWDGRYPKYHRASNPISCHQRLWVQGFISRMKEAGHLRRIKDAGQQVHNYRLFPQDEDTGYFESVEGLFEAVTTKETAGVSLAQLMKDHGKPGTMMLWVPCRSVEGLSADKALFDLYGGSDKPIKDMTNKEGKVVAQGWVRPRDGTYFKEKSKKQQPPKA
jgi:hypothetical protein